MKFGNKNSGKNSFSNKVVGGASFGNKYNSSKRDAGRYTGSDRSDNPPNAVHRLRDDSYGFNLKSDVHHRDEHRHSSDLERHKYVKKEDISRKFQ
jgi:hypothetical protein